MERTVPTSPLKSSSQENLPEHLSKLATEDTTQVSQHQTDTMAPQISSEKRTIAAQTSNPLQAHATAIKEQALGAEDFKKIQSALAGKTIDSGNLDLFEAFQRVMSFEKTDIETLRFAYKLRTALEPEDKGTMTKEQIISYLKKGNLTGDELAYSWMDLFFHTLLIQHLGNQVIDILNNNAEIKNRIADLFPDEDIKEIIADLKHKLSIHDLTKAQDLYKGYRSLPTVFRGGYPTFIAIQENPEGNQNLVAIANATDEHTRNEDHHPESYVTLVDLKTGSTQKLPGARTLLANINERMPDGTAFKTLEELNHFADDDNTLTNTEAVRRNLEQAGFKIRYTQDKPMKAAAILEWFVDGTAASFRSPVVSLRMSEEALASQGEFSKNRFAGTEVNFRQQPQRTTFWDFLPDSLKDQCIQSSDLLRPHLFKSLIPTDIPDDEPYTFGQLLNI
ncbi:hypothetical protein GCM10023116_17510 [Kistimonas scapharcae]|uniref:Uncharacterized protein n=1 Tax=Kistimonas scapharcae TaxID=1036133 RepID=A0ABP8V0X5_9GAMM